MTDYSELALIKGLNFLAENQAAIANNLANVDSVGFKRRAAHGIHEDDSFRAVLEKQLPTVAYREHTDFSRGNLRPTGDAMHVAIEGDGFFLVEGTDRRRYYTRKGMLAVDNAGTLRLQSGEALLDRDRQPISMRNAEGGLPSNLLIKPDGTILDGDQTLGKIGLFDVADRTTLHPAGRALFTDTSDARPQAKRDGVIQQKHLERSNVDSLAEMVSMIAVQRAFQGTARALSATNRIKTTFISSFNR